jgi:hypothetical protein
MLVVYNDEKVIIGTYVRKLGFLGFRRTRVAVRTFVADVKAVDSGFFPVCLVGRGSRNNQGNGGDED